MGRGKREKKLFGPAQARSGHQSEVGETADRVRLSGDKALREELEKLKPPQLHARVRALPHGLAFSPRRIQRSFKVELVDWLLRAPRLLEDPVALEAAARQVAEEEARAEAAYEMEGHSTERRPEAKTKSRLGPTTPWRSKRCAERKTTIKSLPMEIKVGACRRSHR